MRPLGRISAMSGSRYERKKPIGVLRVDVLQCGKQGWCAFGSEVGYTCMLTPWPLAALQPLLIWYPSAVHVQYVYLQQEMYISVAPYVCQRRGAWPGLPCSHHLRHGFCCLLL